MTSVRATQPVHAADRFAYEVVAFSKPSRGARLGGGKPVAVLLPMEDDDGLERLALAYSRRFQAILYEACEQIRASGGIPHDDFWRGVEAETNQQTPTQDNAA